MLQILFVLQAGMIEDIVTDLALEKLLRRKWLDEKDRVLIRRYELECIRIGQSEPLGHVQLVAVLMTGAIEPRAIVDADGVHYQGVSYPLTGRVSIPRRIVLGV